MGRDPFRFDLIPEGSTVICAVSGGADSVYLLDRLNNWRVSHPFTLIAAHYNHCLRGRNPTGTRNLSGGSWRIGAARSGW